MVKILIFGIVFSASAGAFIRTIANPLPTLREMSIGTFGAVLMISGISLAMLGGFLICDALIKLFE